jgi:hypothetical protein
MGASGEARVLDGRGPGRHRRAPSRLRPLAELRRPARLPASAQGRAASARALKLRPLPPPPKKKGAEVVVAQSYARIFFRNCISTGELYPVETDVRLCDVLSTGQEVTVDMERDVLVDHASGKEYSLKPIGEVCFGGGLG